MLFDISPYMLLKHLYSGITTPLFLAVDVTYRCNANCEHCYFKKQGYKNELSEPEWIKKIKKIKKNNPDIIGATWLGGEPLLRKKIIEQGIKLFPFNQIITNGTIDLPKWEKCVFLVSIDGTEKYYKQGRKGCDYNKVKKNINRDDIKVFVVFTISAQNATCIKEFLKEWKLTKIKGVLFIFYTPIAGVREKFWMGWKERDRIVNELMELKKIYDDFILNDEAELEVMKSTNAPKSIEQCLFKKKISVSLGPDGKIKKNCNMGEKADCERCGCILSYYSPHLEKIKIDIPEDYYKNFK